MKIQIVNIGFEKQINQNIAFFIYLFCINQIFFLLGKTLLKIDKNYIVSLIKRYKMDALFMAYPSELIHNLSNRLDL